jgi:hypothetical protein
VTAAVGTSRSTPCTGAVLHATYLLRGLWTWALIRALLAVALAVLAQLPPPALPPFGRVVVLGAVLSVAVADLQRRHEWHLLGNLGVGPTTMAGWFVLPVLVGEVLLAWAVA